MTGFLLWLIAFVVLVAIAVLPAWIAGNKGYSRFGFFVFGLFLWPVAVIVALVVKDRGGPVEPKAKPISFGPQP
jgi:hypothetical protein